VIKNEHGLELSFSCKLHMCVHDPATCASGLRNVFQNENFEFHIRFERWSSYIDVSVHRAVKSMYQSVLTAKEAYVVLPQASNLVSCVT